MRLRRKDNGFFKGMGLITLIALALLVTVLPASAQSTQDIKVTMINQEPDPVAPGNPVIVRFRIENNGTANAQNMAVSLVPKSPLSFYGSETQVKNIGTITAGQVGDVGVRQEWRLFVEPTAAVGDNAFEIWYSTNNGPQVRGGEFSVAVRPRSAVLAIKQVKTTPADIVPGTMTNVSFVLENLAGAPLTDVKLNLQILTPIMTSASVTFRELPFTPVNSGNEKSLSRLEPEATDEIQFTLFTDANAESKAHKVPYTITYSDVSGNNYNLSGIVGLVVDSAPEISAYIDQTDVYSAGSTGTVTLKIVNKGFSDLNFMDVSLADAADYQILSNKNFYIGKLDSDDYETIDYRVMVSGQAQDSVTLPIHVEYRDANGQIYKQDFPVELQLYSGEQLEQRRTGGGSSWTWIIIILVLVIVGFFVFRAIRKRKKKA